MFIDPRGKPLSHLDRLLAWKNGGKPAPVTVEWDLTNVCSLGCQACHFAHTHVAGPWAVRQTAKPAEYSDTGKFASSGLVERGLGEMKRAGVQSIVWSGGGEPTLHPAFVEIGTTAAALGLKQGLYTLGGHLDAERLRLIRDRFEWVVVSLDCADAETYAREKQVGPERFDDVCAGIIGLSAQKAIVGVSFLIHAENWHRTGQMLALARELGATYTTFRPAVMTSPDQPGVITHDRAWISRAVDSLLRLAVEDDVEIDVKRFVEYRDWIGHQYTTCYGIRLLTMVTPDGRVWICPNRRGVAGSELGDLRVEGFSTIWARHPGRWNDFTGCRAMCRLDSVNRTLASVYAVRQHEAFV